jgi:6,7-dimethyl-8-ribityllumazine synthase
VSTKSRGERTEKNTAKEKLTIERVPDPAVTAIEGDLSGAGRRFAIVVSRFNSFITERLFLSAYDALLRSGVAKKDIALVRVPGAFEIPSAARTLAETGDYDAIVCIGCLLRGDTAHYDVIVNEVGRGIGQSAQETGVPHALGVLTCETLEQAIDRAGLKMGNKGFEAALAAVEMANLTSAIRLPATGFRRNAVGYRTSDHAKQQIPPIRSAARRNDKASAKKRRK